MIFKIIVLEEVDVPPGRKSKNVCKTIDEGKIGRRRYYILCCKGQFFLLFLNKKNLTPLKYLGRLRFLGDSFFVFSSTTRSEANDTGVDAGSVEDEIESKLHCKVVV